MPVFERNWDDSKIEQLRGLCAKDLSFAEIAAIMGKSRCAIAGAYHRYIREGKKAPRPSTTQIKFPKIETRKISARHKSVSFPPPSGHCLAIIGLPRDLKCCGLLCDEGQSFCPDHRAIYCVKPVQNFQAHTSWGKR